MVPAVNKVKGTRRGLLVVPLSVALAAACSTADPPDPDNPPPQLIDYGYAVEESIPMDTSLFTQGLEYLDDGDLVLSGGRYGQSSINLIDGETGEILLSRDLAGEYFGEGITVVDDVVHQITWQENTVHTWALPDLDPGPTYSYDGEGWGLCYDEDRDVLWRSDGSSAIFAHDPGSWELLDTVDIRRDGREEPGINELECVDGKIWANVFTSTDILHLDPETGHVLGVMELEELVADARELNGGRFDRNQVLNGIAYDPSREAYLVTGKEWPVAYLITIESPGG